MQHFQLDPTFAPPHSRTPGLCESYESLWCGMHTKRAEMLARVDPTLDRPVILFQDIIEILRGAVLAVVGQIACGLEHGNGG